VGKYGALNAAVGTRYHITGGPLLLVRLPGLPGIAAGAGAGWLINRIGPHRTGGLAFATAAVGMAIEATANRCGCCWPAARCSLPASPWPSRLRSGRSGRPAARPGAPGSPVTPSSSVSVARRHHCW
jgi:hypothetical protein